LPLSEHPEKKTKKNDSTEQQAIHKLSLSANYSRERVISLLIWMDKNLRTNKRVWESTATILTHGINVVYP
jgi:hypothetical protein